MPGTRIDIAGRGGRNHARATAATARGIRAVVLGFALLLGLGGGAVAQAVPEDNPRIQRNVPAEATAENAVVARDRALTSGQRLAYERMAAQLNLPRGLSDQQIQGMVQSLVIESERITPRGYSARITVNFAGGRTPAPATDPGTAASPAAAGRGPAVTTVEAMARYRSFPEWVELNRRLTAAAPVARVEVVTISGDMARLRVALRSQPAEAAAALADAGVALSLGPMDARPGEGWRVSLAGGR